MALPDTDLHGLAWSDGRLWVCDRTRGQVMALAPDTGAIVTRLPLPEGQAPGAEIGWWEGALVHTQAVPEPQPREPQSQRPFVIDPGTGEVRHEYALDWIPRITSATQVHDEE